MRLPGRGVKTQGCGRVGARRPAARFLSLPRGSLAAARQFRYSVRFLKAPATASGGTIPTSKRPATHWATPARWTTASMITVAPSAKETSRRSGIR